MVTTQIDGKITLMKKHMLTSMNVWGSGAHHTYFKS